MKIQTKLRAGKYLVPAQLEYTNDHIYLSFGYSKGLIAEIKMMDGAKWLGFEKPPRKVWRINNNQRNHFQLDYLQGKNPYSLYDTEPIKHDYTRPLYQHQKEAADWLLAVKRGILAAEMGTGKTLVGIEVMERSGVSDWWYVGPKSAIRAVTKEFRDWDSKIKPKVLTYNAIVKMVKDGFEPPDGVWFDESSRIKTPTAQRSQAAMIVADAVREKDGYIILTSGAPAPKSPLDWWHQCEVACPGFLREGNYHKFRNNLAIISQEENLFGQAYPKIVSWLDNSSKCEVCGEIHETLNLDYDHEFTPSVNECERLYKRMKGLVQVRFKKDCLDLPEKIYRTIELPPSKATLAIAKAIVAGAPTVIKGLILLRELSDGFQYIEEESGEKLCSVCCGNKVIPSPIDGEEVLCDGCGGKGTVKIYSRDTQQVDTPKDEALRDLLDEYSGIGRVIIYAGFTGSVDRCVQICQDMKWNYIRVDGRGWHSDLEGDPLDNFQGNNDFRIAFIGQAGSAGMGLTLTASPVTIYYSNDFNAESRIQSEDRNHRIGSRGCTIYDLLHLQTDYLILENLKKKRELQAITMGDIVESLTNQEN